MFVYARKSDLASNQRVTTKVNGASRSRTAVTVMKAITLTRLMRKEVTETADVPAAYPAARGERASNDNAAAPQSENTGESSQGGLCVCRFKLNTGLLELDSSCRGSLSLWVIPENVSSPAFTPATAGVTYEADGYKIGNQIYKIDGSTCVTLSCSGGNPTVDTCVNNLARILGKGPPRPVPPGTFGNEPPAGTPAKPVR